MGKKENTECSVIIILVSTPDHSFAIMQITLIREKAETKMSGLGIEHTISADTDFTYYIKCRDIWNNEPSTCLAKARVYFKI